MKKSISIFFRKKKKTKFFREIKSGTERNERPPIKAQIYVSPSMIRPATSEYIELF